MSVKYVIDKERRLVIMTASGQASFADFRSQQSRLLSDPNFKKEFNLLLDGTAITELLLSRSELSALVSGSAFSARSKRAIVASNPAIFGLGQVAAALLEVFQAAPNVALFRDLDAAYQWLGITHKSE